MHLALLMFSALTMINTAAASPSTQKAEIEYYLSATGLFQGDGSPWNPPDPYVVIKIRDGSASYKGWVLDGQTSYILNTIDPTWDKKFTVDWTTLQSKEIKFQIWDSDNFRDDSLGTFTTAVSELVTKNNYRPSPSFTTMDGTLKGSDEVTGKIHIKSRITSMQDATIPENRGACGDGTNVTCGSASHNHISIPYKLSVVMSLRYLLRHS